MAAAQYPPWPHFKKIAIYKPPFFGLGFFVQAYEVT